MSNATEVLYDLAAPRSIVLTDRKQTFTLICRRITDSDWRAYFSGIRLTSEKSGKSSINTMDMETPRLVLAEAVLVGAYGYKVAGDGSLTDIPNWQKKVPLAHRNRLGEILADVLPSELDHEFIIYPECEEVLLDATFTSVSADDKIGMQKIQGLKHILGTPTEQQHRRYTREASKSTVVGGSRSGRTVYQGCQPLLADLYDELIVSVEGYSVAGVPLTTDRAAIMREMDTLHKVMAAQELFQPRDTAILAGENEE